MIFIAFSDLWGCMLDYFKIHRYDSWDFYEFQATPDDLLLEAWQFGDRLTWTRGLPLSLIFYIFSYSWQCLHLKFSERFLPKLLPLKPFASIAHPITHSKLFSCYSWSFCSVLQSVIFWTHSFHFLPNGKILPAWAMGMVLLDHFLPPWPQEAVAEVLLQQGDRKQACTNTYFDKLIENIIEDLKNQEVLPGFSSHIDLAGDAISKKENNFFIFFISSRRMMAVIYKIGEENLDTLTYYRHFSFCLSLVLILSDMVLNLWESFPEKEFDSLMYTLKAF